MSQYEQCECIGTVPGNEKRSLIEIIYLFHDMFKVTTRFPHDRTSNKESMSTKSRFPVELGKYLATLSDLRHLVISDKKGIEILFRTLCSVPHT